MLRTQEGKTVYALASGKAVAGVSVVRVSGPEARHVMHELAGDHIKPRYASLAKLRKAGSGLVIDEGLVLWFPGPSSFTGEDVVEFHIHGSHAVVQVLFQEFEKFENLEAANPGVFTRRAFLNGKMDLTQVEGLADLIHAESEYQRQQALKHYEGYGSRKFNQWREDLKRCLAYLEICIDFSEEEFDDDLETRLKAMIKKVMDEIEISIRQAIDGERLRKGFRIVLAGDANVGKSTLLNALTKRDVAIVSNKPGTTRDILEVHLDLKGLPIIVPDTAGLRATDEEIEKEGIKRALDRIEQADLVINLLDGFTSETNKGHEYLLQRKAAIRVWNKIDLGRIDGSGDDFMISAKTGEGLDKLIGYIYERAKNSANKGLESVVIRERHKVALKTCLDELGTYFAFADDEIDLKAESLRGAIGAIGGIVGNVGAEEILDVVFSDFCIGK
jgi:tRNA modification GTPase